METEYVAWMVVTVVFSAYMAPVAYGIHRVIKNSEITINEFMMRAFIFCIFMFILVVAGALFFKFFGWLF